MNGGEKTGRSGCSVMLPAGSADSRRDAYSLGWLAPLGGAIGVVNWRKLPMYRLNLRGGAGGRTQDTRAGRPWR